MKNKKPICFFDLETTGTDVQNDRIVEIAIIKIQEGSPDIEKRILINPEIKIPTGASDVHNITDDIVKDSPTFKQISKSLLDFLFGCDLAGYNCNYFDVPLLYNEFQRSSIEWDLSDTKIIDVCSIFKRKEERTLSAAMKFYCKKEIEDAHSALGDVRSTINVFEAQKKYYEDLPDNISDLDRYCNYDSVRCDVSGNFKLNENNEYVFNFGKNKGKIASCDKSYLQWMLTSSFNSDTKKICMQILNSK